MPLACFGEIFFGRGSSGKYKRLWTFLCVCNAKGLRHLPHWDLNVQVEVTGPISQVSIFPLGFRLSSLAWRQLKIIPYIFSRELCFRLSLPVCSRKQGGHEAAGVAHLEELSTRCLRPLWHHRVLILRNCIFLVHAWKLKRGKEVKERLFLFLGTSQTGWRQTWWEYWQEYLFPCNTTAKYELLFFFHTHRAQARHLTFHGSFHKK